MGQSSNSVWQFLWSRVLLTSVGMKHMFRHFLTKAGSSAPVSAQLLGALHWRKQVSVKCLDQPYHIPFLGVFKWENPNLKHVLPFKKWMQAVPKLNHALCLSDATRSEVSISACGRDTCTNGWENSPENPWALWLALLPNLYQEKYILWLTAPWSEWAQYWQDGFPYLDSYKEDWEMCLWCGIPTFQALIRMTAFPLFPPPPSPQWLISRASWKQRVALPPFCGKRSGRVTAVRSCCRSTSLGVCRPIPSCGIMSMQGVWQELALVLHPVHAQNKSLQHRTLLHSHLWQTLVCCPPAPKCSCF